VHPAKTEVRFLSKQAVHAAAMAAVSEMLGLEGLLQRMPGELSGGQRQRVAMGRAIVRRPQVFMFDEPLSNLDAALRSQVRVDIRKLHDELQTTSVYVTHDQVEAMTLADVMFVMNEGKIEQSGPPLEIFARPATRFVAGFLGSPPMSFIEAVIELEGDAMTACFDTGEAQQRVPLDPSVYREAPQAGQRVVVGLRPHELRLAGDAAPLRARVKVTEKLGAETHVYAVMGGSAVSLRLDGDAVVEEGQELRLAVKPACVHLFDPDSGVSWW
jgi:sn-glycerol 3-phosphate transport system ATP-binding protein/multiple sugar transport system ATP-binding protein